MSGAEREALLGRPSLIGLVAAILLGLGVFTGIFTIWASVSADTLSCNYSLINPAWYDSSCEYRKYAWASVLLILSGVALLAVGYIKEHR